MEPVYESSLSHIPAAACTHLSAPQALDLPLDAGLRVVAIGVLTHSPVTRRSKGLLPPRDGSACSGCLCLTFYDMKSACGVVTTTREPVRQNPAELATDVSEIGVCQGKVIIIIIRG